MTADWINALPPLRGRLQPNAPLGESTWFAAGGAAELLFRPKDAADLADFLRALPLEIPVLVIGVGSNMLVRDGGLAGAVIRLGGAFAQVTVDGARISAGAGALDLTVAQIAAEAGVGGMEFLSGVPGVIGGALRMNAGAFGGEMAQVFRSAEAINRAGAVFTLDAAAMGFGYRHCQAPSDAIFLRAELEGRPDDPHAISDRMAAIRAQREATQPGRARTGGSTFKNPPGQKAWELIDRAGCRGLRRGGAMVSEKHCNFLINEGGATAADIEDLGEEVRARVLATSGVTLEWEIRRVGRRLDASPSEAGR